MLAFAIPVPEYPEVNTPPGPAVAAVGNTAAPTAKPQPATETAVPTPRDDRLGQWSQGKAALPLLSLVVLGLLAGALMGLGAAVSTLISSDDRLGAGVARWIGGIAISLGFAAVVIGKAELWTGNCLMAAAGLRGSVSGLALARNWGVAIAANAVGAAGLACVLVASGAFDESTLRLAAIRISESKLALAPEQALLKGILGGALVCFGVWLALAADTATGKTIVVVLPVSALVALGFEHSATDLYLIPAGLLLGAHGAPVDAAWTLAAVTAGNVVGAAIMVAGIMGIAEEPADTISPAAPASHEPRPSIFAGANFHIAALVLLVLGGIWSQLSRHLDAHPVSIASVATPATIETARIATTPPETAPIKTEGAAGTFALQLPSAAAAELAATRTSQPGHDLVSTQPANRSAGPRRPATPESPSHRYALNDAAGSLAARQTMAAARYDAAAANDQAASAAGRYVARPDQDNPAPVQQTAQIRTGRVRSGGGVQYGPDAMIAFIEDASRPIDPTTWFVSEQLRFKTDTASLTREASAEVRLLADILKAFPSARIAIAGFGEANTAARDPGTKRQRARPAERARAVAAALSRHGIATERVAILGHIDGPQGADQPGHIAQIGIRLIAR